MKAPWIEPRRRFPAVASCWTPRGAPCPSVACRYHLAHRGPGEHRLTPTRDCALVVANEGEHSLDEVATAIGMTRERVRQLEHAALEKLRRSAALRSLHLQGGGGEP